MKKLLLALVLVVSSAASAVPPKGYDFNDIPPVSYFPPCSKKGHIPPVSKFPPCSKGIIPPVSNILPS